MMLPLFVLCLPACMAPSSTGPDGSGTPVATELSVLPGTADLMPGEMLGFTAWEHRNNGDSATVPVSWSATGGSISSMGSFTAGGQGGSYQVIARSLSTGMIDTAVVAVVDTGTPPPPPPPPPPPGPQGLANECAQPDAAWIWCDDFDQDRLGSYFEYATDNNSFLRTAAAGADSSWGMVATWAQGQKAAGALHLAFGRTPQPYFRAVDAGTANYRELWWRFYLKNQAGWTGGGGDKLTRATSFVSASSWAQSMFAHVWSGGNVNTRDYLVLDPASGTDTQGAVLTTTYNDFPNMRWLGSARGATPLFATASTGQWRCVEVHVRLNDAGASNGVFEFWLDGNLEASRTALNWLGSYNQYGINAVFLENYWNAGSPVAQSRTFDNFVVSTARVGC